MKRKWIKRLIVCFVILLTILLTVFLYCLLSAREYFNGLAYKYRYRECAAEELLPDLERVFDVNFPEVIKEIKTAKTPGSWDSNTSNFIVKFCAEPDTVNTFLRSFPEDRLHKVKLYPYASEFDRRNSSSTRPPPEWFTEPITKGEMGGYRLAGPKLKIYIDTSDETNYVVYLHGFL